MSPETSRLEKPTKADLEKAIRRLVERHVTWTLSGGDSVAEGEILLPSGYSEILGADRIGFRIKRDGDSEYPYIALLSDEGEPDFIDPDMDPAAGMTACQVIEEILNDQGSDPAGGQPN